MEGDWGDDDEVGGKAMGIWGWKSGVESKRIATGLGQLGVVWSAGREAGDLA